MKIYKVCHSAFFELAGTDCACAPDFVNDVKVFTSKRRAINYATQCMWNYRDILGYDAREVDRGYIRTWVLVTDKARRIINVIEDETK